MNIIKKNSLIFIIISLLTIQSVKSITILKNKNFLLNIYGSLSSQYLNKKIKNKNISIIFKGKNKINKNLTIFGKIKKSIKINNKNNKIKTNLFYIGIKDNCLGIINYGKNFKNINNTLSYINIFPHNKNKIINNNINNNLLTYKKKINLNKNIPIFKNIIFILQYQNNNNNNNNINNIIKSKKNKWGYTYNLKTKYGIELSTSYILKKYNLINNINYKKNILKKNNYINKNILSTGIKYNLNKLYLGSTYTEKNQFNKNNNLINKINNNKNNIKNYNFNIVIKYNFKSGITSIIGYTHTKKDKIINKNNKINILKKNIEKYFNITTIYKFNNLLNGYLNYKINQLNNNKNNNENILSLGFNLNF